MLRIFLFTMLLMLLNVCIADAADGPKTYKIDSNHTRVLYFVDHLGFSKMPGHFSAVSGTITFDPAHADSAALDVEIDAKKLTMDNTVLDSKLQGPEYFNTAKFPAITFKSTRIVRTSASSGDVTGELTFLGVTKPVTLKTTFNHLGWDAYAKANSVGFSATGTFNRSDFGMKTLLPAVGDKIALMIEVEANQPGSQPAPAPAAKTRAQPAKL